MLVYGTAGMSPCRVVLLSSHDGMLNIPPPVRNYALFCWRIKLPGSGLFEQACASTKQYHGKNDLNWCVRWSPLGHVAG